MRDFLRRDVYRLGGRLALPLKPLRHQGTAEPVSETSFDTLFMRTEHPARYIGSIEERGNASESRSDLFRGNFGTVDRKFSCNVFFELASKPLRN